MLNENPHDIDKKKKKKNGRSEKQRCYNGVRVSLHGINHIVYTRDRVVLSVLI